MLVGADFICILFMALSFKVLFSPSWPHAVLWVLLYNHLLLAGVDFHGRAIYIYY